MVIKSECSLEETIINFEVQKNLFTTAYNDLLNAKETERIYSLDFAVLYPYVVPHRLQHRLDDPLKFICNNIFLLLDEKIKSVPIEISISFPTTMEIVAQFAKQKKYFDKIANSEHVANQVKTQLVTGIKAANIIQEEVLKGVKAHYPDDNGYKCLRKFVEHLKDSRITGLGDHFDVGEFSAALKKSDLTKIQELLQAKNRYSSSDTRNVAFRRDMDALHLIITRFYHDRGILYTGPRGTRHAFGKNQSEYARSPEHLLCLMHALKQSNGQDSISINRGMQSYITNGIDFCNEAIETMRQRGKVTNFSTDELRIIGEKDKIYRREMYMDRRNRIDQSNDNEVKEAVKNMTTSQFRDANKLASQKISENVDGLKDILSVKPTKDMLDFISSEGKDYVSEALEHLDLD